MARVVLSCGLFLLVGIGFMVAVGGFQNVGNANSLAAGGNVQQEDERKSLSSRDRFSNVGKIEIGTDEKYGRYLPNNKCRVQLIHDIEVPALEAGQIKEILVKENQRVSPVDVLAQIRDDIAVNQKEAAIKNKNVAEVDAKNDNRVKYARQSLDFATDIYQRKKKLYEDRGSINFVEFREAQYQESQAQLQLDEAFTQQKVANEKLAVEQVNITAADAMIERHKVRSLLQQGEVAEIFVQKGEWVNRGDKVARVIDMENLKITGRADAKMIYPEQIDGRPVIVTLILPNDATETFTGRVVRINLENSVSDKYYFEVEVKNRKRGDFWILRPNAEVGIKVLLDQEFK